MPAERPAPFRASLCLWKGVQARGGPSDRGETGALAHFPQASTAGYPFPNHPWQPVAKRKGGACSLRRFAPPAARPALSARLRPGTASVHAVRASGFGPGRLALLAARAGCPGRGCALCALVRWGARPCSYVLAAPRGAAASAPSGLRPSPPAPSLGGTRLRRWSLPAGRGQRGHAPRAGTRFALTPRPPGPGRICHTTASPGAALGLLPSPSAPYFVAILGSCDGRGWGRRPFGRAPEKWRCAWRGVLMATMAAGGGSGGAAGGLGGAHGRMGGCRYFALNWM